MLQQKYSQEMTECLINDMMDLVKLDNGAFKFVNEYFDIRMAVFKAINIIKAQATLKRIKLVGLIENHQYMHLLTNVWGD